MDSILEKLKNFKIPKLDNLFGGKKDATTTISAEPKVIKEINLVPDIKNDFIKTLKFRNLVFFICIVVAISSTVVILIFLSIAGGQQSFITAKQNTIESLQKKIEEYSDLSDFLTIRDQLSNIAEITNNKVMMSRTFNILSAMIPTGDDYINISELTVNLENEEGNPTFTIDAQANAGTDPQIDYKVLDSFKKSMQYLRYDYGKYVDKNDQEIPSYCIIESDADGSTFRDPEKGYYAYWLIEGEGCNPSAEETEDEEATETEETTSLFETQTFDDQELFAQETIVEKPVAEANTLEKLSQKTGYKVEEYNGQNVVKIWRTPQYTEWYKPNHGENEAYMDLEGNIHNVPHFNSACIQYSGTEKDNKTVTWATTNESCALISSDTEEGEGIKIESSSNGRNAEEVLVLRFNAIISFNPEVFNFNNHHLLALPPVGRRNVTDSYAQIQSIFAERANDCDKNDSECITTPTSDTTNDSTNNSNEQEQEETW